MIVVVYSTASSLLPRPDLSGGSAYGPGAQRGLSAGWAGSQHPWLLASPSSLTPTGDHCLVSGNPTFPDTPSPRPAECPPERLGPSSHSPQDLSYKLQLLPCCNLPRGRCGHPSARGPPPCTLSGKRLQAASWTATVGLTLCVPSTSLVNSPHCLLLIAPTQWFYSWFRRRAATLVLPRPEAAVADPFCKGQ